MNSFWYMMNFTGILILVAVVLSACGLRVVQGSGNITTESRPVSNISEVNFTGFGELTLVQGNSESLTIKTDDNLLPYVKTTVSDGILTIGFSNGAWIPLIRPTQGIHYQLTVKSLKALDMSGAGTVIAAQLETDNLRISEQGAGQIKIDKLTASGLDVNLSGAGKIGVAGKVMRQSVVMSGLGSYEAGDLESQSAKVVLSGAGSATVWVSESLDTTMSGVGSIRYYGSPQTHSQASGIGQLQSLGDK